MEKDKWIKDAFDKATPLVAGMNVEEFSKHTRELMQREFPFVMTAFQMAYGEGPAVGFGLQMLSDRNLFMLVHSFFTAGYKARIDEEESNKGEGGNGDD